MIVEDTDEEPRCVICGSDEECAHLVANIDRTFLECYCGVFLDWEHTFRSEIQEVFLKLLRSGKEKKWRHDDLEQMWGQASNNYPAEGDDLMLDGYAFYRFVVELLEGAGAIDHPGSVVDDGGPGMTSSVSLLYSKRPKTVVKLAFKNLRILLKQ